MLFKEGFHRASPKPIHLVASKPKNKDIYEHFGFEVGLISLRVIAIPHIVHPFFPAR